MKTKRTRRGLGGYGAPLGLPFDLDGVTVIVERASRVRTTARGWGWYRLLTVRELATGVTREIADTIFDKRARWIVGGAFDLGLRNVAQPGAHELDFRCGCAGNRAARGAEVNPFSIDGCKQHTEWVARMCEARDDVYWFLGAQEH